MIEESKYCVKWWKKYFNKKLVINKEDNEILKNCTKRRIYNKDYIGKDVKVRYYCCIAGKYRGSAHRDFNINLKLNYKIHVVFQNLEIKILILLYKN